MNASSATGTKILTVCLGLRQTADKLSKNINKVINQITIILMEIHNLSKAYFT